MTNKNKEIEVNDHQLSISRISVWLRLLSQNKIDKKYRKMTLKIWSFILMTTIFQWIQFVRFYFKFQKINFRHHQPVFILGHWRSGTTHLHYLMARDEQFGILSNYQALLCRVSLLGGRLLMHILSPLMPEKRPQDNIKMTVYEPAEEEQPLTNFTHRSGMQSFFFPKNISYYDKYNLFKGLNKRQIKLWKRDYLRLLKVISHFNHNKPLLLKNPHNTARGKVLQEMFPKAKFVFIHRNPYDVYLSNIHLYKKTVSTQFLQEFSEAEVHERVMYCYETMLKQYIDHKQYISPENLIEIRYEDLEENPYEILENLYKTLDLPGYEAALPNFTEYLDSVKDYQKNTFREIAPHIVEEINQRWDFSFKEWGYEKM